MIPRNGRSANSVAEATQSSMAGTNQRPPDLDGGARARHLWWRPVRPTGRPGEGPRRISSGSCAPIPAGHSRGAGGRPRSTRHAVRACLFLLYSRAPPHAGHDQGERMRRKPALRRFTAPGPVYAGPGIGREPALTSGLRPTFPTLRKSGEAPNRNRGRAQQTGIRTF